MDELHHGGYELVHRQEAVPVLAVVPELEDERRRDALGRITVHTVAESQSVGVGKARADLRGGENVWIILHHIQRLLPVAAVQAQGVDGADIRGAQVFHEGEHVGLEAEGCAELICLTHADAPQGRELLRMVPQDVQGIIPEGRYDERRRRGADALDDAACEVVVYRLAAGGHHPFDVFRLELLPVGRVARPGAPGGHALAACGQRDAADHRRLRAIVQLHAQDGIAVVLVEKEDVHDAALNLFQLLFHQYLIRAL